MVSDMPLSVGLSICFCTCLFPVLMRFPSLCPETVVLPLNNQVYGFLIQITKPSMQGSLISRYYISPKVAIWPTYSVNIWCVT